MPRALRMAARPIGGGALHPALPAVRARVPGWARAAMRRSSSANEARRAVGGESAGHGGGGRRQSEDVSPLVMERAATGATTCRRGCAVLRGVA